MTPEQRANRLVGDMPWVTAWLSYDQIEGLKVQIATAIQEAVTVALVDANYQRCVDNTIRGQSYGS